MRKSHLIALGLATAGIVGLVSESHAAVLNLAGYTGALYIKYDNVDIGKLYTLAPGQTIGGPAAGTPAQQAAALDANNNSTLPGSDTSAEDFWGVALVDSIQEGSPTGPVLYDKNAASLNQGIQLTAMFVRGQDLEASESADGTEDTVESGSVQVGFFAGPLGSYNITAGPTARTNPGGVPTYPGVNGPGNTLIWSFNGVPGVSAANPDASFISETSTTLGVGAPVGAFVGNGAMFLDSGANVFGTGTQNAQIFANPTGPDMTVQFTVNQGSDGWLTSSADPALTVVVPSPSSATLAGIVGIMALAFRPGRRMRSRMA